MSLRVGELHALLKLDDKDFRSGVDRAEGRFSGLATNVARGGLIIGTALVGIGVATGVMAAGFEKDMANVATLLGRDGSDRVKELGADVKRLSTETGKPLDDLAGGLYQVVSAFGDTADSAAILEISAKASTAGLATTTDAVNLLSGVTKGYGDTSAEAVQKASDLAFATVRMGQTTFPELAASMGQAIPLAKELGVSQEELFAIMATGTGVTGNTAAVTTQLRGVLQSFMAPTADAAKVIASLGYESGEAMIAELGLKGATDAMVEAAKKTGQPLQAFVSSIEGQTLALALSGSQSDVFAEKYAAMSDVAGETAEAFEIQQATVSASFDRIMASGNVLMVSLGEKLLPVFQSMLDWVLDNMPAIQETIEGVFTAVGDVVTWLVENVWPGLLVAFTFLATDVMPVVLEAFRILAEDVFPVVAGALSLIADNIDILMPGLVALGIMVGIELVLAFGAWAVAAGSAAIATVAALAPVLAPIAAVALGVTALGLVWREWGDDISRIIGEVARTIRSVFGGIGRFFSGIWDGVAATFKGGVNAIIGAINHVLRWVSNLRITIPSIDIPFFGTVGGFSVGMPPIASIPRLATGGRILNGGAAIVGEQGPELVHLGRGAEVVSNRDLMAMFGAGGEPQVVHYHRHFSPNVEIDSPEREPFSRSDLIEALQDLGRLEE